MPAKSGGHSLFILRDDMVAGGTKRRALDLMLADIHAPRVAYAGTTMGHGALALALAARDNGKQPHIFIATDDIDHPILQKIQDAGALLHLEEPQPITDLYAIAKTWQSANNAYLFEPGFASEPFQAALCKALSTLDTAPYSEIWTCAVSGTFANALKKSFPDKRFKIVSVAKSTPGDYTAPEKYHQAARIKPPYPSCSHTDAKIWQFATEHGLPNALIWNIAG